MYIKLERDRYGYATYDGEEWNTVCAEHNDALRAWNLAGHCSRGNDRVEDSEEELSKLRRQIEDRLRKDRFFLYQVAVIFDRD